MNTDLISRADAEALFRNARSKLNPSDYKTADEFNTRDLMLLNAEQMIHLLPSVTPKQKTGQWIKRLRHENAVKRYTGEDVITGEIHTIQILERYDYIEYYCSECGSICADVSMNYCCVCGAKMVEPQGSEG